MHKIFGLCNHTFLVKRGLRVRLRKSGRKVWVGFWSTVEKRQPIKKGAAYVRNNKNIKEKKVCEKFDIGTVPIYTSGPICSKSG